MFDIDFDVDLTDLSKYETEKIAARPLNFVVTSAEGCYLTAIDGKRYLDLTSNKECNPLGYSVINRATDSYLFDSELFTTVDSLELKNILLNVTGLNNVLFTSSRIESYSIYNSLIKTYLNKTSKNKILVSCLSNKQANYHVSGTVTQFIPLNDDAVATSLLSKSVGAVVVDVVQIGEEVNIATSEYLTTLKQLCEKNGALLVIDACSVSPMRTLKGIFNFDSDIIKPDILLISNSVAQGHPFGAVILSDKFDSSNIPVAGTAIQAYKSAFNFINQCTQPEILNIIKNNSLYMEKSLNELAQKFITIADVISYGMLFTLVLDISAYDFVKESFNRGIIIEALNPSAIKLSPPYNIGKDDIDKLIFGFEEILSKLAKYDRLM